ncbi:MAG: hypothetical protein ACOVNU_03475 [Candidatus Kapaibacteriota bacterium]
MGYIKKNGIITIDKTAGKINSSSFNILRTVTIEIKNDNPKVKIISEIKLNPNL